MELWDARYKDGTLAGKDLIRGEDIPQGLYHLVCEVLVRHVDGDYLLMQRDFRKEGWAGCFEASAGGSALKGEDKLTCIRRELREETGISEENFTEVACSLGRNSIYASFVCVTNCDKNSVTLQEGETISYRWVNEEEFKEYLRSDNVVDTQIMRMTPYYKKIGLLD